MINLRRAPARAGVLSLAGVLLVTALAYGAATTFKYSGQTSQTRPISLTRGRGYITNLQYHIDDRCPTGRSLFVHNWGFPALQIEQSKFGGTFSAKAPVVATAIIAGKVSGNTVSGSISDRTQNQRTHAFCHGRATFRLTRKQVKHEHDRAQFAPFPHRY